MTVDSYCPESRKVAIKWFKAMRDAYMDLLLLDDDKYTDIENQVLANLKDVRERQKGVKVI